MFSDFVKQCSIFFEAGTPHKLPEERWIFSRKGLCLPTLDFTFGFTDAGGGDSGKGRWGPVPEIISLDP